jgi:hypothetical protein
LKNPLRPWIRLAVVLTGLWLVGISFYAGLSWRYPYSISSPFVEMVMFGGVIFLWGFFAMVALGGAAACWLLTVGIAWVMQSFRDSGSNQP